MRKKRITLNDLRDAAAWLNEVTGSPTKPFRDDPVEGVIFNVGFYTIFEAFGGYTLARMTTSSGGTERPLTRKSVPKENYMPARELLGKIEAYGHGCMAARADLESE